MKKSRIKKFGLLIGLLFLFLVFIYFKNKPYNYEKKYNINNVSIVEKYISSDGYYLFNIKYKNIIMPFLIKSDYKVKRNLIESILLEEQEDEYCILPQSKYFSFYPLCSNDKEIYTYSLSSIDNLKYNYKIVNSDEKKYNSITINTFLDNTYLFYNYKGFNLLNNNTDKYIKLFDNDVYKLNLVYQKGKYLLVANYNQQYYFNEFYLINTSNGKVKTIRSEYDISFDSVFLNDEKNYIYLIDNKENMDYRIDIKNEIVEIIDKEENENKSLFEYKIIEELLYKVIDNTNIQVSDKKISKIVKTNDKRVYYLSEDKLLMYDNIYGEVILATNFEWKFNNTNMIFIYE